MIASAQWLGIWMFGMEVPSSNAGFLFHAHPEVTILLEYFDPVIYSSLVFAL